jgi:hypothetical protein
MVNSVLSQLKQIINVIFGIIETTLHVEGRKLFI